MLNLVGRNLRFAVFKTTSVERLFPRPLLCSSSAASDNSSSASFSSSSFSDRVRSMITFFENQGFTKIEANFLVQRLPDAHFYHPQIDFLPKFEFLSSTGLSDSDIVNFINAKPGVLGTSLENYIKPTFNLLRDVLQSNDRSLTAIKRCPQVFLHWTGYDMIQNMKILGDVGVPGSNILHLLTCHPRAFLISRNHFKRAVDEVVQMGFDPLKLNCMTAVHVIRSRSKFKWRRKMETYEKWGFSKDQILQAFRIYPLWMTVSEKKIDKVMDFLVNKMGFETSIIVKNPSLISSSVERWIIPKSLVYQYCLDNSLMKDENYCNFFKWLRCTESMFMKRLELYEKEAPGVLKFYQEKLDDAK